MYQPIFISGLRRVQQLQVIFDMTRTLSKSLLITTRKKVYRISFSIYLMIWEILSSVIFENKNNFFVERVFQTISSSPCLLLLEESFGQCFLGKPILILKFFNCFFIKLIVAPLYQTDLVLCPFVHSKSQGFLPLYPVKISRFSPNLSYQVTMETLHDQNVNINIIWFIQQNLYIE